MEIEFDPSKDEINRLKHGVPLVLGAEVLMNRVGQIDGERRDYTVRNGSMHLAW